MPSHAPRSRPERDRASVSAELAPSPVAPDSSLSEEAMPEGALAEPQEAEPTPALDAAAAELGPQTTEEGADLAALPQSPVVKDRDPTPPGLPPLDTPPSPPDVPVAAVPQVGGGSVGVPRDIPDPPPPGPTIRPEDGRVDWVMEQVWDSSEYEAAYDRIGGPATSASGMPLLPMPPSDGPAMTAATLIPMLAVSGSDLLINTAVSLTPGLGILQYSADALQHGHADVQSFQETRHDETAWDEVVLATNMARETFEWVGRSAASLADLCSVIQDLGLAASSVTVVSALGELAMAVGMPLRSAAALAHGMTPMLDLVGVVGGVALAREHEAAGNFQAAELARQMAAQNTGDLVADVAMSAASVVELATLNHAGGASQSTGALAKLFSTLGKATQTGLKIGGSMARPGLAHALSLGSGVEVTEAEPLQQTGPATADLAPARQDTLDQLGGAAEGFTTAPPLWYQGLINDYVHGSDGTEVAGDIIENLDKPTAWMTRLMPMPPGLIQLMGTQVSAEDMGQTLRSMAEDTPVLSSLWDGLLSFAGDNQDTVDSFIGTLTEMLQDRRDSLSSLSEGIETARTWLGDVGGMLDFSDEVQTLLEGALESASGLLIDESDVQLELNGDTLSAMAEQIPGIGPFLGLVGSWLSFLIPDWVWELAESLLQTLIDTVVGWYNGLVSGIAEGVADLVERALLQVNEWIQQVIEAADQALAWMEEMFGEGSQAEALLQSELDAITGTATLFQDAINQLVTDGEVDWDLAGQWFLDFAITYEQNLQYLSAGFEEVDRASAWDEVLVSGQDEVDGWRSAHGQEVETSTWPQVPSAEQGAVEEAAVAVAARAETADAPGEQQEATALQASAASLSGRGADKLVDLWEVEEELVTVDRRI